MPADYQVPKTVWGEPSCLCASAMCCLEVMSNLDILETPTDVYNDAVAAGLYAPTYDVAGQIVAIMSFVGARGVACEGGRVYGAGPYPLPVPAMLDNLRAGMRPFVYWYPTDPAAGLSHAVCALAVSGGYLITSDQSGLSPTGAWSAPVSWALEAGLGAFAYASHSVAG